MRLTKLDKAKVIVTALCDLKELVTEDNKILWRIVKRKTRLTLECINHQYKLAVKVLEGKIRKQ